MQPPPVALAERAAGGAGSVCARGALSPAPEPVRTGVLGVLSARLVIARVPGEGLVPEPFRKGLVSWLWPWCKALPACLPWRSRGRS